MAFQADRGRAGMRASEELMYRKARGGSSSGSVREAGFWFLNSGIGIFIYQAPARAAGRPPWLCMYTCTNPSTPALIQRGCALLRNNWPLQADAYIKVVSMTIG